MTGQPEHWPAAWADEPCLDPDEQHGNPYANLPDDDSRDVVTVLPSKEYL
ncbi:hypothetical protein J7F03_20675 [Streptomyces sp. ISL-43]|nr:hypothetical protein [Streptomyces sp. ISL-43]MBT2449458.1 hypothetical protein [Streptomyces sp. ISL-43]